MKIIKVILKENLIKERTIDDCVNFAKEFNFIELYCIYTKDGYNLFTRKIYDCVPWYIRHHYGPIHARIRRK